MRIKKMLCLSTLFLSPTLFAQPLSIAIKTVTDQQNLGTVSAEDTAYGLLLTPTLSHVSPGAHGFHLHEVANCQNGAQAAGGHWDPQKTDKHLGPYNNLGHLGDLPALTVNADGTATLPVLAPRLKSKDLKGHALIIHEGGDNYSDSPQKLGGGGARVACGEVK